jgi:hypothetical protein
VKRLFVVTLVAWWFVGFSTVSGDTWMSRPAVEMAGQLSAMDTGNVGHERARKALVEMLVEIERVEAKNGMAELDRMKLDRLVKVAQFFDARAAERQVIETLRLFNTGERLRPADDVMASRTLKRVGAMARRAVRSKTDDPEVAAAYGRLSLSLALFNSGLFGAGFADATRAQSKVEPADLAAILGFAGDRAEEAAELLVELKEDDSSRMGTDLLPNANALLIQFIKTSSKDNRDERGFDDALEGISDYYQTAMSKRQLREVQQALVTLTALRLTVLADGHADQARKISEWIEAAQAARPAEPVLRWLGEVERRNGDRPVEVPIGIYPSDPNDPIWKGRPPQ